MPLLPGAEAYAHEGGPVGALVVHGFTGSPRSMRPWGEQLADAGLTVSVPRLPGHGTRWQDMSVTRWDDWYAEVDRSFTTLRDRCEQVFAMGLSMGGSLCLRLAEQRPDEVGGLVLVNPAVHTERRDRHLLRTCGTWSRRSPASATTSRSPGRTRARTTGCRCTRCTRCSRPGCRSGPTSRRSPRRCCCCTRARTTSSSRATRPGSSQHVTSAVRDEVWLEDSYHVATLDNDFPLIVERSLDFVRAHAPAAS